MTDNQQLAELAQAADDAWKTLNATHRAMPDCAHNQAWHEAISAAQDEHRKAVYARDRQRRKMAQLNADKSAGAA